MVVRQFGIWVTARRLCGRGPGNRAWRRSGFDLAPIARPANTVRPVRARNLAPSGTISRCRCRASPTSAPVRHPDSKPTAAPDRTTMARRCVRCRWRTESDWPDGTLAKSRRRPRGLRARTGLPVFAGRAMGIEAIRAAEGAISRATSDRCANGTARTDEPSPAKLDASERSRNVPA